MAMPSGTTRKGFFYNSNQRKGKNMATALTSDTRLEVVTRKVTLTGLTNLMFDRYAGDNNTKLDWSQKIYLIPGTNMLCLPTTNIISFVHGG